MTLVESRKDMSDSQKGIADEAISHHITSLIYTAAITGNSAAGYTLMLQPMIKARGSMEKQNMGVSKIDRLIQGRLDIIGLLR